MEIVKAESIAQPIGSSFFDRSQIDLIKSMYFAGSTDSEFEMFMHICKKTGLDPILKQIHPVKRWDSKLQKEVMTVQTAIDGYRLIAERSGKYSPGREPTYKYDDKGLLISATAYVKKMTVDGTWHEVAATAFFEEYVQRTKDGKPTSFWVRMGHNQLAKCAEALAIRKAFPADLSGIYTHDEMQQAYRVNPEEDEKPLPKPVLLSKDTHTMIKEPSAMNRFFCFETCDGDLREYILEQSQKQAREIPEMVDSINQSEERYKMFWKAYSTWKVKRAQPSSPAL